MPQSLYPRQFFWFGRWLWQLSYLSIPLVKQQQLSRQSAYFLNRIFRDNNNTQHSSTISCCKTVQTVVYQTVYLHSSSSCNYRSNTTQFYNLLLLSILFYSIHYIRHTFWRNFNIQLLTNTLYFWGVRPFQWIDYIRIYWFKGMNPKNKGYL